ncbi:hypothetical protein N657DRAFT_305757 [Parathielavia appendiculata]|uniref:Uncharacterized protein n=1 Tax=Parathielavia appendiculata TaxID=2587402 RepID=A0AAN6Z5E9_9PEZI|nr:hypothetical protein N657DRAFT_305757 [Parathielavia appendiculata]
MPHSTGAGSSPVIFREISVLWPSACLRALRLLVFMMLLLHSSGPWRRRLTKDGTKATPCFVLSCYPCDGVGCQLSMPRSRLLKQEPSNERQVALRRWESARMFHAC